MVQVKVMWHIRATLTQVHDRVGAAVNGHGSDNSATLHENIQTSDGVKTTWDCGDWDFARAKELVVSFLAGGDQVFLYKQVGNAVPVLFTDDEIDAARKQGAVELKKLMREQASRRRKKQATKAVHKSLARSQK